MSRLNQPCNNNRISGCTNIVTERGSLLCKECLEQRKASINARKEQEFSGELQEKNKYIENLLKKYNDCVKERDDIRKEFEEYKKIQNTNLTKTQLEKDNQRMIEQLNKFRKTIEELIQKNSIHEAVFSQLKLDHEKLVIENKHNKDLIAILKEQNELLSKENEKLIAM